VIGAAADELLADRPPRVELVALPEQRDAQPAGARDGAGVRRLRTGDQPQQRRLAVAVAPDHADALSRGHAERHVAQHRPAAVALGHAAEVDQVARRHQSLRRCMTVRLTRRDTTMAT
jgi:hypothetical protein